MSGNSEKRSRHVERFVLGNRVALRQGLGAEVRGDIALNLPSPEALLYALLAITATLIAIIVVRPSITVSTPGKMLAFVAFCVLPILCGSMAASTHIERSKQTKFCLSCHIMEPYGRSLYVDDPSYIPASHFQNHRVPPDEACYTCHTDYGLYGGVRAKLGGLRHIYIQYFGTPPRPDDTSFTNPTTIANACTAMPVRVRLRRMRCIQRSETNS
jgi:NapC/NirT cytochrome c family protein